MSEKSNKPPITDELEFRSGDTLYRSLVERASDGIAIIQDTLIKYINPYMVSQLGYTTEEMLDTPYTDYLTSESRDKISAVYRALDKDETPPLYETVVLSKNGMEITFEVNTSIINFRGTSAEFVLFRSLEERQQRKRITERIQQFQKLESLGVLAGGIAHDFNNLLQGILGNADLAILYESDAKLVKTCLLDIKMAATRASELAFQMLAYSGKGSFEIRNLSLNEIISETSEMIKVSTSKKTLLKYDLAESIPDIRADRAQLRQVIINLITNAAEAIGDKPGVITLKTGQKHCDRALLSRTYLDDDLEEGPYVFLEVTDTGEGMDESIQSKIFDPFFSTKFTGRGLGLAAVLGIIRAHLGAIQVISHPKQGTTFSVYLPTSDEESASDSAAPSSGDADSVVPTILVVDDESTVRITASRILERFGYNVLLATNGKTAIRLYRQKHDTIDIVLLDMMMPRMDGKETFEALYQIDNNVKTILMTGYAEDDVKGRFVTPKPRAFLQKPFGARALINKLKEISE